MRLTATPISTFQMIVQKKVSAMSARSTHARILSIQPCVSGAEGDIKSQRTYRQKNFTSCGTSARRLNTTRQMLISDERVNGRTKSTPPT